MDEQKGGGDSVRSHAEPSQEATSEHVALGSETLGDSQPEGSSDEILIVNGGGSVTDSDVKVELSGSRVHVGGLRASNGGDGDASKAGIDSSGAPVPDAFTRGSESELDRNDGLVPSRSKGKQMDESSDKDGKTDSSLGGEGSADKEKSEVEVKDSEAQGLDDSAVVVKKEIVEPDASGTFALDAEEVNAAKDGDKKGSETVEKITGGSKEMDIVGGDIVQERNGEKLGALHDAEGKPVSKALDGPPSAAVGCSNVKVQHIEGQNDSTEAIKGQSASTVALSDLSRNNVSTIETACGETADASAIDKGQDEQVGVVSTVEREGPTPDADQREQAAVVSAGKEIDKPMETDSVENKSSSPPDKQLEMVESVGEGMDNDDRETGDGPAFNPNAKEIAVESTETEVKESHVLEKGEEVKSEECKETGTTHHVDSNDKTEIEICNQNADRADDATKGETEATDSNNVMDPNFDIANCIDFSGVLSCSGTDGHVNSEMVATEVAVDSQETHNSEVPVAPRIGQMPTFETCLDKSGNAAPDSSVSGLNTIDEMDVDKQATGAESIGLHPEENTKVDEPLDQSHEITGPEGIAVASDVSREASNPGNDHILGAEGGLEDKAPEHSDQSLAHDTPKIDRSMGQEVETKEDSSDAECSVLPEEIEVGDDNTTNTSKVFYAGYQLPPEDKDNFSVSDLVWGKVRSHPWWPGQVFDPSDASEEAMKHNKENCLLVAYFGDGTFAWNDTSQLKPFLRNFYELERQSSTESFKNAVNCALEEISRRVALGLACSCLPKDVYDNVRFQTVGNSGIREESSRIDGLGKSVPASSWTPHMLVHYIKALARSPSHGASRLDLEITKVQLLAFYRLKGYCKLPEFQSYGKSLENDANSLLPEGMGNHETVDKANGQISSEKEATEIGNHVRSYNKRKHNLKDGPYGSKKQKSLSELMDEAVDSPDSEAGSDVKVEQKKRKIDNDDSSHEGRKTITVAKVSLSPPQPPRAPFKIGDCIRRAASQLTGSPSILKSNNAGDGSDVNSENFQRKGMSMPPEVSSTEDLLYQLRAAAQDPMEGQSSLDLVSSFFSDFRNSKVPQHTHTEKIGGKRSRSPNSTAGPSEAFEFEDMNDTYWTDRMIDNGEDQQSTVKRGYQIVPVELKPIQRSRRPYTKRKYPDANRDTMPEKPLNNVDENAPAELIINFSEMDSLPSEMKLNRMFRHFGPIRESLTEVDKDTSRVRVVFKKCSDAEVAVNSAGKFNIFGPMVVNYQLNYSITEQFKVAPYFVSLGGEDASLCLPSQS